MRRRRKKGQIKNPHQVLSVAAPLSRLLLKPQREKMTSRTTHVTANEIMSQPMRTTVHGPPSALHTELAERGRVLQNEQKRKFSVIISRK